MSFNLDNYVDVAERITQAKKQYPDLILRPFDPYEPYRFEEIEGKKFIIVVAAAYRTPDDPMPAVGMAWECVPGNTPYTRGSELMNAETSAWGRALAALGLATKKIATREEVEQAQARTVRHTSPPAEDVWATATNLVKNELGATDVDPELLTHQQVTKNAEAPSCQHGLMKFWAAAGKRGHYYCTQPKGSPTRCERVDA